MGRKSVIHHALPAGRVLVKCALRPLGGLRCARRRTSLIQVGGKEPGLIREPGKMRHPELTGMDDGHAETSESGAE